MARALKRLLYHSFWRRFTSCHRRPTHDESQGGQSQHIKSVHPHFIFPISSLTYQDYLPTTTHRRSNMRTKTVDLYWNAEEKGWKNKDTISDVPAELVEPVGGGSNTDQWEEYDFVIVRRFPDPRRPQKPTIGFKVVVKSVHLLQVCQKVIGQVPGLSWNTQPVEVRIGLVPPSPGGHTYETTAS